MKDISDLAKLKEHEEEEGQVKVKGGYAYSHAVELLVDWLINYKTTDGMPSICYMLYAVLSCCIPHITLKRLIVCLPCSGPGLPCSGPGLVWSDAN